MQYKLNVIQKPSDKYWDDPYYIIISGFDSHQETCFIRDNILSYFYRNNRCYSLLRKFRFSVQEDLDSKLESQHLLVVCDIVDKKDAQKIYDMLRDYLK